MSIEDAPECRSRARLSRQIGNGFGSLLDLATAQNKGLRISLGGDRQLSPSKVDQGFLDHCENSLGVSLRFDLEYFVELSPTVPEEEPGAFRLGVELEGCHRATL
jgi:hypothetical protein